MQKFIGSLKAAGVVCRHTTSKPAVIHALEHEHIVQVAAGGWHCLAVSKSGSIYAWGGNEYFQCGVDAGAPCSSSKGSSISVTRQILSLLRDNRAMFGLVMVW